MTERNLKNLQGGTFIGLFLCGGVLIADKYLGIEVSDTTISKAWTIWWVLILLAGVGWYFEEKLKKEK